MILQPFTDLAEEAAKENGDEDEATCDAVVGTLVCAVQRPHVDRKHVRLTTVW